MSEDLWLEDLAHDPSRDWKDGRSIGIAVGRARMHAECLEAIDRLIKKAMPRGDAHLTLLYARAAIEDLVGEEKEKGDE